MKTKYMNIKIDHLVFRVGYIVRGEGVHERLDVAQTEEIGYDIELADITSQKMLRASMDRMRASDPLQYNILMDWIRGRVEEYFMDTVNIDDR